MARQYEVTTKESHLNSLAIQINKPFKNSIPVYLIKISLPYKIHILKSEASKMANMSEDERVEYILKKLEHLDTKRYKSMLKW